MKALTLLWQLSWRNIWRYRRRNSMLLLAILVAVSTIVLASALIRGWQADMLDAVVGNLTGNVKVLAPGYQADPSIENGFELPNRWQPGSGEEVLRGWTSRVVVPGVILSERDTRGVQLVGIDPGDERAISFLGDVGLEGEMLRDANDNRVLVGRALAERIRTRVGRRIVLMSQGSDGRNREAGFRVAGIYDASGTGLEKAFVFTGREALQRMLQTALVTEVSLRLEDGVSEAALRDRLAAEFERLQVSTWRELEPQVAALFEYADLAVYIWFSILMTALGFGLVNTLVTVVMERTRELDMLRAVGMSPGLVICQVVLECLLVVSCGVLAGLLVGSLYVYQLSEGIDLSRWAEGLEAYYIETLLVPRLQASDLLLVSGMSLFFGLVASLYPAWKAVRIGPLQAMHR